MNIFRQKGHGNRRTAKGAKRSRFRATGKTPSGTHIPVLKEEVLACLKPAPGNIVVDCTVGYGGHALEFMKKIGPSGKLIGLDVDHAELQRTRTRIGKSKVPAVLYRSNFSNIAKVLSEEKLDGCDIIFADLGVSSMQIDDPSRGISYKYKGPLDMRMDDRLEKSGVDLLNSLSAEELSKALWEFSDEPDHEEIAQQIVAQRALGEITQTSQLVRLVFGVKEMTPKTWRQQQISKFGTLHPAARTFQALRILVNNELGCLEELLRLAPECLRPGGRIGIISFHSGEDRMVKRSLHDGVNNGTYESACLNALVPRIREIKSNPRSSSAKFRWASVKALHQNK